VALSGPPLPYTPVVRAGPWLIVSGQVGLRDGTIVPGGVRAEAEQALSNLAARLADHGAGLADVAKTTVFLTDIADFAAINEVYAKAFGDRFPARSAVAVAALPMDASFEVEAWAYCPGPGRA
jgi:2-iminobutanoate/2-iminopropanoate deaminase